MDTVSSGELLVYIIEQVSYFVRS